MAAPEGCTIISQDEENNNVIVPDPNAQKPRVADYFEVVNEFERKCRQCAAVVKVKGKNDWGMKQHIKFKHSTEWATKFEPFVRPKNSWVRIQLD